MSTSTERMIPEHFNADSLGGMPDFSEITPEMIDYHVRRGREMRSHMLFELVGGGWRALRNGLAGLSQRLFGPSGHLGAHR